MRMMIYAAASLLTLSGPALAATIITFDGVFDYNFYGMDDPPSTYFEDGYSIGGTPASWGAPGDVHLDDSGTMWSNYISVTTEGLFSALAMEIYGLPQASVFEIEATETSEPQTIPVAHENVWFRGFVDDVLLAERGFSSGLNGGIFDVRLGPDFASLDRFEIFAETRLPSGAVCWDAPCGHFTLDNLIVGAPAEVIPLPAAGWLLGGAIGALLLRRRRGMAG